MNKITVIGLDGKLPPEVDRMAERIGEDIANSGCVLICGGKKGVMEAACRGAKKAGGITVGILPSFDGSEANDYVDVVIPSGMGYARNTLVVSSGDAIVSLNGSTGTLSEIAMALNYGKPVFCIEGSGGVTDKVRNALADDKRVSQIKMVKAEDAIRECLKFI
ncbi:MAG: TIGR00725 family protein [Candidatus Altiarchaeales archaeon]|nr:TIGR00725 family protein [Candidatus Altiarchaeales archaeon]MBD3416222.1 TIGR00725 family protein [Candidatus Altiarchaeales archaeon]